MTGCKRFVCKVFAVVFASVIVGVGAGQAISGVFLDGYQLVPGAKPVRSRVLDPGKELEHYFDFDGNATMWTVEDTYLPKDNQKVLPKVKGKVQTGKFAAPQKTTFDDLNVICHAEGNPYPGSGSIINSNLVATYTNYECSSNNNSPTGACPNMIFAHVLYKWNPTTRQWVNVRTTDDLVQAPTCNTYNIYTTYYSTSIIYNTYGAGLYTQSTFLYNPQAWAARSYANYYEVGSVMFNVNWWTTW